MTVVPFRRRKVDAQLLRAVHVLTREIEHLLVTRCDQTPEQAEASVRGLLDLPGLPEKLKAA